MADTTQRLGLPYPEGTDLVDVPGDIQALAQASDTAVVYSRGPLAARPPSSGGQPGVEWRVYEATDTGEVYWDKGTSWELLRPANAILIGELRPVAIAVTAGTEPAGWLLCDGRAVSRTTYSALYTALGAGSSPYGQGDGSSTFNLPDFRGRGIIGAGQGTGLTSRARGTVGGTESHTLSAIESGLPAHLHGFPNGVTAPVVGFGVTWVFRHAEDADVPSEPGWSVPGPSNNNDLSQGVMTTTANAGPTAAQTPHNNMPPWAAAHVLIRAHS